MRLHLIRHAHAVDAEEDPRRPLSARGRTQVARLVAFFRVGGRLRPAEIWHSSLARSRETAALLARGLDFSGPVRKMPGLEPEDDPRATAGRLTGAGDGLVIVGHEPHLSSLATLLLSDAAESPVVVLKKGACLALDHEEGIWRVRWLVDPGLIGPKD
jgi:phosphohistidine phosphatase